MWSSVCQRTSKEVPMAMVCGLDLHRGQVTFDAVDVESGEVWRGRIWQPDRQRFRRWLRRRRADACRTGTRWRSRWRAAPGGGMWWRRSPRPGSRRIVAEPADTQAARGRKRRAKTDRTDARLLRELLADGELPESWIPPEVVLEWRERVRVYKALVDQRTQWVQRIHAELFQHGVACSRGRRSARRQTRERLRRRRAQPSAAAGRQRIALGYSMIDAIDARSSR